jgi:hypothetical protein
MEQATAIRLTELHDLGYKIHIQAGRYVTSFVKTIGKADYDDEDDMSPYVYSDDTIEDRPLSEVSIYDVQVYAPIDIWKEEAEEIDEVENVEYSRSKPMILQDDSFGPDEDDEDDYLHPSDPLNRTPAE